MSVFGGSSAVSLQFHIVHTYESLRITGELCNSLMQAAAPTYGQVLQNDRIWTPPLKITKIPVFQQIIINITSFFVLGRGTICYGIQVNFLKYSFLYQGWSVCPYVAIALFDLGIFQLLYRYHTYRDCSYSILIPYKKKNNSIINNRTSLCRF